MVLAAILAASVFTILFSRRYFNYLFNPVSIYAFVWGGMLYLYELKLLKYVPLNSYAWLSVVVCFLIFLVGSITPFVANINKNNLTHNKEIKKTIFFIYDEKLLSKIIVLFAFITLIGASYTWFTLYRKYESFAGIFLAANEIYTLRNQGELTGLIPYLGSFSAAGLILAGLFTAIKNKITLVSLFPIFAATIRDISIFARVGLLISIILFLTSFFISKNFLKSEGYKMSKQIIIVIIIAMALVVSSASLVRMFRGSYENYKVANKELSTLKKGLFISPSVYLYLSSHVGVFSKYLDENSENNKFGENTFAPLYNFLSKFDLVESVPFHQKGYYIPMWSNSSTYLRELHADFGTTGMFILPYFIGLLTTILWIRFYSNGKLIEFLILTCILTNIALSFFSLIIRSPDLYFAIIIIYVSLKFIEKKQSNFINDLRINN